MPKRKAKRLHTDRLLFVIVCLLIITFLVTKIVSYISERFSGSEAAPSSTVEKPRDESKSVSQIEEKYTLTVVIDAGHGGKDVGSLDSSETRYEKNDNLEIALLVCEALEENPHIRVIMTRSDDTFVSLEGRCEIANEADADFLVSLHRNSASVGNGIEIWINTENNSDDRVLAQNILSELSEVGITDNRGIREGYIDPGDTGDNNYYVNSHSNMPSCLVELGFITYSEDNLYFDTYKHQYAHAIADGIIAAAEITNAGDFTNSSAGE